MKYRHVNIVLTPIPHCAQVVLDQTDRDKNVKQLLEVMNDVYSFVNDAELVKERVGSQKQIVVLMVEQTIQCAYFIRDYSADIHFGTSFLLVFVRKSILIGLRKTFVEQRGVRH